MDLQTPALPPAPAGHPPRPAELAHTHKGHPPPAPPPAPAGDIPGPAELDEMHKVHAVHDLLDVAGDLPQEVKWALLDYAAGVFGGSGQPASAPPRTARTPATERGR